VTEYVEIQLQEGLESQRGGITGGGNHICSAVTMITMDFLQKHSVGIDPKDNL
jgi:hypothetical protein